MVAYYCCQSAPKSNCLQWVCGRCSADCPRNRMKCRLAPWKTLASFRLASLKLTANRAEFTDHKSEIGRQSSVHGYIRANSGARDAAKVRVVTVNLRPLKITSASVLRGERWSNRAAEPTERMSEIESAR